MKDVIIKCKVTGHSDGPKCPDCGRKTDTIVVVERKHELNGQTGSYCYHCLTKEGII